MKDYNDILEKLRASGNLRSLPDIVHRGKWIEKEGQTMLNLSSNDYLGLSSRQDLRDEFIEQLQESGLPVLLTYSGNERILSDTTQTETKAAVESLPDGQVVLDPFVNGDHNYTSEDPATNTQLDADLRQVTVDFLTSHLQ